MTHASKAALFTCVVFILIVIGVVVNYYLFARYVGHVNSDWCDTLKLLTSHPVPKTNPQYQLYTDFVHLRNQFGCQ